MNKILITVFQIFFWLSLSLGGPAAVPDPVNGYKAPVMRIAVFGGEAALGTSAKLDILHDCFQYETSIVNSVRETQTWWSILGRILSDWTERPAELINVSVPGGSTAKEAPRRVDQMLSQSPDLVLLMPGQDEAVAGMQLVDFCNILEEMIHAIAAKDIQLVLVTPPPISERMTSSECSTADLRRIQARLSSLVQAVRQIAGDRSLPLIDLSQFFLDNRLAYEHLFEGRLPDGVAQSAMASFMAGELLPLLGVDDFPNPVLSDYRKVYSSAGDPDVYHNAFTDLIFFQKKFFIAFRKAHSHGVPAFTTPASEAIMVLSSDDGINWGQEAVLKVAGLDNRDPKFLNRGGSLFLYAPCTRLSDESDKPRTETFGFERMGPGKWSKPFFCAPGVLWRPRKWGGQYVAAAYAWPEKDAAVRLVSSRDGRRWKFHSAILPVETDGNETDLLVEGDTLTAFSRAGSGKDLLISEYAPSKNRWETVSSGRIIHAPNVFKAGGRLMICGRYCSQSDERFRELRKDWAMFTSGRASDAAKADIKRVEEYHHGLRSGLFVLDGLKPRLVMEFLSAGDSSYTGVVQYGGEYVFSDYSMHEHYRPIRRPGDWNTPSDIYVIKIRFY
jgi:hypothetical protein